MDQCDYWWLNREDQWCELISGFCKCGGRHEACSLDDQAVAAAVKEEEEVTLEEASIRARKRRGAREAS